MTDRDRTEVPNYAALTRLDGRVFVVLGAGAGIGRQSCHALAQAGAKVVCVDREAALAAGVAEEVGGVALTGDVTLRADMVRLFAEARERAGPVRGVVDIVGIANLGPLAAVDDTRWKWQFDMVLNHAFLAIQIGGKAIAEAGGGAMVFVASMAGIVNLPGQAAYGAAKASLIHLVASMSKELAPKVRINAVAPGFVRTPRLNQMLSEEKWAEIAKIIPVGAAARPSEIAAPILFLASDSASHVTGQTLLVDGGIVDTVRMPSLTS